MSIDVATLAAAWECGADASHTPRGQEVIRAHLARTFAAFERLPFRVVFTPVDPFQSYEHMRDQVRSTGIMPVWTGASEGLPMWDAHTNAVCRAVHDADHLVAQCDFSMDGEVAAYQHAAARCPALAPLYHSEIVLQAASFHAGGAFGPQKLVLDSPLEV